MVSQDQYARRIEESAESGRSIGASYALPEQTSPPEPVQRTQGQEQKFRSKKFLELRQLEAVNFYGTTDPTEAWTWLKRTERVLGRMNCTLGERFVFLVSLL